MWSRLRTTLVVLAISFGLLTLLEGAVRVLGPRVSSEGTDRRLIAEGRFGPSPGLRPGTSGRSHGARFAVDREGFLVYSGNGRQGPEWLFLGDSVTMGIGVDPDSTFAGRLSGGWGGTVLNPSLIGYALDDYERVFGALAGRERLSRVILFWCLNDVYGPGEGAGDPGAEVRRLLGPALRFVRRHVRTYTWAKAIALDRPRSYYEYVEQHFTEAAVAGAVGRIGRMARLADSLGVRFDVVLMPYELQLREAGHGRPQEMLTRALEADSIAVHDPREHLVASGWPGRELYLYGDGIHLSARGHALMAEFLRERLGCSEPRERLSCNRIAR
jgi:lysophospholipase L1-like esterase